MIPWHTLISMMNPSPQFDTDGNLIRSSDPDRIRLELLSSLSQHTGRNVLTYYSGHLFSNQYNVAMDQYDTPGIINAVDNLDPSVGLDLILHTPGGSVTFAEGLVKYLHQVFQDIRVIIPQEAFSAGTIVALASKEILMGPMACIGPIDCQIIIEGFPMSSFNLYTEIKAAQKAIGEDPSKSNYWSIQLGKYPPGMFNFVMDSIQLSGELAEVFLSKYMFSNDSGSQGKIKKIVATLNSTQRAHGRHFDYEDCKQMGLKVHKLSDDPELEKLVMALHHVYSYTMQTLGCVKTIENQKGRSWYLFQNMGSPKPVEKSEVVKSDVDTQSIS